ncbi:MAG TPA: hypothetical protein VHV29_06530 [Terriglobales bacterium]|jgi:hypothetical protein|nr:hypothetical protein [Terriglobales bacterium]
MAGARCFLIAALTGNSAAKAKESCAAAVHSSAAREIDSPAAADNHVAVSTDNAAGLGVGYISAVAAETPGGSAAID